MLYSFARLILSPFFFIYNRFSVHDRERIPRSGAFIIVANHSSYLDPIFTGLAVKKRKLRFMAKKESFKNTFFAKIITALGAFPVDRSKPDIKAIKTALRLLKDGEILVLFPQGGRRLEDELTDIKQGAAYFAIKANVPIIPMYIKGADQVMPKGQSMIKPKKINVFVGEPVEIPDTMVSNKNEMLDLITNKVKDSINDLSKKSA